MGWGWGGGRDGGRGRGGGLDQMAFNTTPRPPPLPLPQPEGGPCGVIASMNAFVLRELVHARGRRRGREWENPSASERRSAVMAALATIIWTAGSEVNRT